MRLLILAKKLIQKIFRRLTIGDNKPTIFKNLGFGFRWNDKLFRDMNLETTIILVKDLEWNLDLPFWEEELIDDWNLTPREVISSPGLHRNHSQRVNGVDMSFPICVTRTDAGKWFVVDGTHRLAKAFMEKRSAMEARIVPKEKLLEISRFD